MSVLGRSVSLLALVAAVLVPTGGGGSDAARAVALRDSRPAKAAAPAREAAPAGDPTAAPVAPADLSAFSPGHGPKTRFGADRNRRELLLSFDDGPDLKGTPLILEELDRRGLKAIFFVTRWRFAAQPPEDIARRELLRKIAAHSHLLANHNLRHPNLCDNPDGH